MSAPEIINPGAASGGTPVGGSGTPGKLAKFTGTGTSIGDSLLSESGTTITSAATAETFGSAQTWTVGAPNSQALVVLSNAGLERTLVLDTISRAVGVGVPTTPATLLHVSDGVTAFAGTTGAGVRLDRASEALFSSSDGTRSFRAGVTGATVVAGSTTSHDLLLQRGNVTALTLGASGAVAFAGNLTSSAAQTWTLAAGTSALNIQSGLLNIDTTNSRVGIGTASPVGLLNVRAALNATNLNLTSTTEGINSYVELRLSSGDATGIYPNRAALIRGYTAAAGTDQNELAFFTASSGAPAEAMRITYDKKVGIGTTSPASKLDVAGTITCDDAGTGLKLAAAPGNADAQTLDCYLENPLATTSGNGWTPTLSAAATWGGTQPNVTYARYVRIGSMVFCEVKLTMATGTMTSTYGVTTIDSPFTTNANASHSAVPVAAPGVSGVGFQTGTTVYLPTIGASSTFILAWSFFA